MIELTAIQKIPLNKFKKKNALRHIAILPERVSKIKSRASYGICMVCSGCTK